MSAAEDPATDAEDKIASAADKVLEDRQAFEILELNFGASEDQVDSAYERLLPRRSFDPYKSMVVSGCAIRRRHHL